MLFSLEALSITVQYITSTIRVPNLQNIIQIGKILVINAIKVNRSVILIITKVIIITHTIMEI